MTREIFDDARKLAGLLSALGVPYVGSLVALIDLGEAAISLAVDDPALDARLGDALARAVANRVNADDLARLDAKIAATIPAPAPDPHGEIL